MSFWGKKFDDALKGEGLDWKQSVAYKASSPASWRETVIKEAVLPEIIKSFVGDKADVNRPGNIQRARQIFDAIDSSGQYQSVYNSIRHLQVDKQDDVVDALKRKIWSDPSIITRLESAMDKGTISRKELVAALKTPGAIREVNNWNGDVRQINGIIDRLVPPKPPESKPKEQAVPPKKAGSTRPASARASAPAAVVAAAAEEVSPEVSPQTESPRSQTIEKVDPDTAYTQDEIREGVKEIAQDPKFQEALGSFLPKEIADGFTRTLLSNEARQDDIGRFVGTETGRGIVAKLAAGEDLTAQEKTSLTAVAMPVLFAQGIEGKAGSEGVLRSELRGALTGMNLDPNLANTFSDGVLSSPKAQENLARLATENPELLQRLTSKDANRSTAEIAEVKRLMENPKLLEDDKYIAEMRQKAGMGQMLADASRWMQDTLGIDLTKILGDVGSDLGGMFNQIMSWVSGLFGNMGDGNFMRQMAGPNGSQGLGGMMERFSSANQYAMERSGLSARVSGAQAIDANGDGKIDDKDRFKIVDAQGNETFGYATNLNRAMVGGQVVITDIDSKTGKATGGHTTIYGGVVSIYDSNGTKLEGDVLKQRAGQLGVGIQPPSQTPGMGMANAPPPV